MTDESPAPPKLREHLRELGHALRGIGHDVELDAANAPAAVKEGTKDTLARAAGIRRSAMREWHERPPESP